MDGPEAPLISDRQRHRGLQNDGEDDDPIAPVAELLAKPGTKPSAFVLLLTLAAGISGLLFGYDTGVISATLVSIGTSLSGRELTSLDKSVITSSTSLFALAVSPLSSVLADKLGRKRVILYADGLFLAGSLVQCLSGSVAAMTAGRCIVGAGVGAASFVVPLYIAEVAPSSQRGRLVTMNVLFITLGQAVAYIVGWLFSTFGTRATAWRWMVGLGGVPAAVQAAVIVLMPETPRWLVKVGRSAAAKRVIQRVNGQDGMARSAAADAEADAEADALVGEIEMEARQERQARQLRRHGSRAWLGDWQELLREGKNRRALAIACLLQGLQQLCGFNSLMYFSATIFTMVGFRSPTLTSLVVAVTNLIFTTVALSLIDRVGRRRILLRSIPFMIAGLLAAAFGFSLIPAPSSEGRDGSREAQAASGFGAPIILVSIMVYVASFALGLGNVPWMQSELFPLSVRSLGSGVATATNWGSNFAIGLTFLPLMDALTPPWTFVLYALVCVGGYVLIWRIYPETAGLSLEEATALLEDGWGVR
ncbi:MFS transporter, SP family, solute carrier family 2 (myo-inositol transporter), member 13 [Geosmithia morbida]|uniref:MFS transporter, SP family, solute carrier family 2 (Myo-inositol transporter), member 13 n=1 Tax=Geosmithia morbida TaxID=1094350 RepID=A0A9P4YTT9_9HYPO|nr:MFS transporter, SP family, solute carrier family 2 (myo-inositol transporter), member 13 [Geosmithia morbida]KAF4121659.1 MFS transporter, SP family, solute carrier family 2 (myo-inositol transporter), member 13 [Geosmithia morbida]